jgi:hypothetical protein
VVDISPNASSGIEDNRETEERDKGRDALGEGLHGNSWKQEPD